VLRWKVFVTLLILLWVCPLAFAQAGPNQPVDRLAQNTPHSLPGTAWKIDFGRGVTGTIFRFPRNGRWEIVPNRPGSIGAVGKSYTVSGSTLTTVNADDGMVQKWTMTWQGDILELNDGKTSMMLHYNGTTQD